MWRDDDGLLHTVALPDPSSVLPPDLDELLVSLEHPRRMDLFEELEALEVELFDRFSEADVSGVEGEPLATVLLPSGISTAEGLLAATREVEAEWRLDVILALQDRVIEIEED